MRMLKTLVAALSLIVLAACVRAHIRYDYDVRVDFSKYQTFDWNPELKKEAFNPDIRQEKEPEARPEAKREDRREPRRTATQNRFMDMRMQQSLENELKAKGYRLAQGETPDFYVTYYPIYRERAYTTTTHWGWGWGWRPWYGNVATSQVHHYEEGTLVVEIRDAKSNQMVWHGAAVGALTDLDNPEDADEVVQREVKRLLERFPK